MSTTQTTENTQIAELEAELLPAFMQRFGRGKLLSPRLVEEIHAALGGAPRELFMEAVHERLRRPMANPRHLLNVAQDVRAAYTKHNEIAERERAAADADRARRAAEADAALAAGLEQARARWRSGKTTAEDRRFDLRIWPELADEFPALREERTDCDNEFPPV